MALAVFVDRPPPEATADAVLVRGAALFELATAVGTDPISGRADVAVTLQTGK